MKMVSAASMRWSATILLTTAVTLTAVMAPSAVIASETEAALKKASAAYDASDYQAAYDVADAALKTGTSQSLVLFRARAALKLNRVEDAWKDFQKIQPGQLAKEYQEIFVTEYEAAETAYKKAKQAEADAKSLEAKQAKESASGTKHILLIAGGVGLVAGGVLAALGLDTAASAESLDLTKTANHATYNSERDTANVMFGTGVGLAVVGAGLGVWALLQGDGGDTAQNSVFFAPRYDRRGEAMGLTFGGRF